MKCKFPWLAVAPFSLVLLFSSHAWSHHVEKYSVMFAVCAIPGDSSPSMVMRSFTGEGKCYFLIVNLRSLATRIVSADSAHCDAPQRLNTIRRSFATSPYVLALDSAEQRSTLVQDAGIVRGRPGRKGINLTADLCPSSLPLDRSFFNELIEKFLPEQKPIPIALAVTGNWMYDHPDDLHWLIGLADSGIFNITWINHSYNHRWCDSLPLDKNFLESKGTNLDVEVLKTERKMIENGMMPSVFFRFPGLVSDSLLFRKITAYGLIPVGTDAWLAKKQSPKDGSIVLVHANGNEPYGIRRFFGLLRNHRDGIAAGSWLLYDLRASIAAQPDSEAGSR